MSRCRSRNPNIPPTPTPWAPCACWKRSVSSAWKAPRAYHPENSHVIPALIRRFHEAKETNAGTVTIWGTGTPRREFLYVDDLAEACVQLMNLDKTAWDRQTAPQRNHLNIGTGADLTIRALAETIARVVGYTGKLTFDPSKPDGTPRKLLDVSRINALGWRAATPLERGLALAYADFLAGHGVPG